MSCEPPDIINVQVGALKKVNLESEIIFNNTFYLAQCKYYFNV